MNEGELARISALLKRKLDEWWKATQGRDWTHAAYLANDIEAAARHLAFLTHKLNEENNANTKTPPGSDSGAPDSPARRGGW